MMSVIRQKVPPIIDMLIFLGNFEPILSASLIWLAKEIRQHTEWFGEFVCNSFSEFFLNYF